MSSRRAPAGIFSSANFFSSVSLIFLTVLGSACNSFSSSQSSRRFNTGGRFIRIPWYGRGMIKTTVSMTPELYSALTRAALDSGTNVSREIETHLRESAYIQKYIQEVRAEPAEGAHLVNPRMLRAKSKVAEATVSS